MNKLITNRLQGILMPILLMLLFSCSQDRVSPPREATGTIEGVPVSVNYSSPGVKDRKVWGELVPYGQVWRTGANEATVIEFGKDVLVEGESLPAGKYALFTVPNTGEWTIIFNKVHDQWGAFEYDETQDILKVQVTPTNTGEFMERLIFEVDEADKEVAFFWENLKVAFTVAAQ